MNYSFKSVFILISLGVFVRFTSTKKSMRRCLLFNERCVDFCPQGMHAYHTRCDVDAVSQRTCRHPDPIVLGYTCGWSRCDCNEPRVMTDDYTCVDVQNCPEKLRHRTYTGHCPLLKFRYGRCYGHSTRQILKEIRQKGLYNKPLEYRPGDNYELDNMPRRDKPRQDVYDGLRHRQPVFMTGYTGYVPGMNFRYGKSYGRAADDCMADFTERQRDFRRKADFSKSYIRSQSAPKMETIHTRDEIRRELNKFREINKYKENTISPEFPPIAGYTGHIPRIKGSEASLSQRYHCAAKRGLELIRMEGDKRKELHNAEVNVREILKEKERKPSYWNWG